MECAHPHAAMRNSTRLSKIPIIDEYEHKQQNMLTIIICGFSTCCKLAAEKKKKMKPTKYISFYLHVFYFDTVEKKKREKIDQFGWKGTNLLKQISKIG